MQISRIILVCAALTFALVLGCAEEQTGPPVAPPSVFVPTAADNIAKVPLASDLVFCLDVSDSTSADELQQEVSGLLACLANSTLIPVDGSVRVGLVVYADTSATVLGPLTAVTADNLPGTIGEAFQGLLTNRGVGTTDADLVSALNSAATLLAGGTPQNQHIIIVGDGRADDPAAAAARCAELGQLGTMVSALAVDADAAGAALLAQCAGNAGGVFVLVEGSDIESACAATLAFATEANLVIEPTSITAPKDTQVQFTVTLFRGVDQQLNPLAAVEVVFSVQSGPNAGETDTTQTDAHGQAVFTLLGDGGSGTDQVLATVDLPPAAQPLQAMAEVIWENTPPSCDAGAAQEVLFTGDPVTVVLDATASSDPDTSDTLAYLWSIECESAVFDDATSPTPRLTLDAACGCGDHTVTLVVTDGEDETTCQTTITLLDGTLPVIVPRVEPVRLWPPNHKLWTITPAMTLQSVSDLCDLELGLDDVRVLSVRSDEPDDAQGDGHTDGDIVINCDGTALLRAERAGGGNGRVYLVTYQVVDAAGNAATAECRVLVPHDQSDRVAVLDPQAGYEMAADCD